MDLNTSSTGNEAKNLDYINYSSKNLPGKIKPTKSINKGNTNPGNIKITLYQSIICQYCGIVRAYLDYYGYTYDIVEVNSISKSQLDWTIHKKVPQVAIQLTFQNNHDKYYEKIVQIIDSTAIISAMEALRLNSTNTISKMTNYLEKIYAGGIQDQKSLNDLLLDIDLIVEKDKEREWRNWIYSNFIHVVSPNIYRTMRDSIAAYYWFDKVGEWGNLFSRFERMTITYLGSSYMYLNSMNLKRKHGLKEDVRESLYEYCNKWTSAPDFKSQFMGGLAPNLADLTLYGTINTFEGCQAFADMTNKNPLMKQWYESCKLHVNNSLGNSFLKLSTELTPTQTKQNKSRILFNFIKQNFISPISP